MTFKEIVRILGADLKGESKLGDGLRKVKGISFMYANAVCHSAKLNSEEKVGNLSDEQINKLTDIIKHPTKYEIPSWMFNRKKDRSTGEDKHVVTIDLKFEKEFDLKRLMKLKVYRGVRHSSGLPVRGQRTRGNFRSGKTVGVRKKSLIPQKKGKK